MDEPFDPESPQVTLFYPWLFHVWRPDPIDTEVEARCLHSIPPTQAYLIARGKGMDQLLYRYLSACLDSPFGFFEIIIVDQREQLLEDEAWEREEALKAMAEEESVAADALGDDGLEQVGAEQALNIDPAGATGDDTTLHKSALMRYDFSNRELYWDLVLPLLNPAPPQLHNTDGDRLSMQRLIFAIDSPAAAFEALKGLAVGQSEEELLQDAEYAADGELWRVAFNWTKRGNSRHKGWETTVLGRIDIGGTQLAAEVNSGERAAEFKRLVGERLGEKARYRVTVEALIQDIERMGPGMGGYDPSITDNLRERLGIF